jgi:(+)-trans-carveol dehydrogenase
LGELEGKVALITGGARGQGRAHAVRFAQEGAQIVFCDVAHQVDLVPYPMSADEDFEQTVAAVEALGRRCVGLRADVRSADDMNGAAQRCFDEFGRLDILVANAGIGIPGGWDTSEAAFDTMVEVNLKGVFMACRAVIPFLIRQGVGGSLILTSSVAGVRPYHGLTAYVAAKHGVVGLMRSLAADLGPYRIRVNALLPGLVNSPMIMNDTFMSALGGKDSGGTPDDVAWFGRTVHLLPQSWIEPESLAHAAAFLASDKAACITGAAIPVDLGTANQPPGLPLFAMAGVEQLRSATTDVSNHSTASCTPDERITV